MARNEVDLRHHRLAVGLAELQAVEGVEGVLVRHRRVAELRAGVPDVPGVVELVVVVERALRPVVGVGRYVADRPPSRLFEGVTQGEAVAGDEGVVTLLAVDPQPRLQGRMGQPADRAERRRGEEGAPGGEPGGLQCAGPRVQDGVDPRREARTLHSDAPVALDEGEDDVLAAQAGQQVIGGDSPEGIACRRPREGMLVPDLGG